MCGLPCHPLGSVPGPPIRPARSFSPASWTFFCCGCHTLRKKPTADTGRAHASREVSWVRIPTLPPVCICEMGIEISAWNTFKDLVTPRTWRAQHKAWHLVKFQKADLLLLFSLLMCVCVPHWTVSVLKRQTGYLWLQPPISKCLAHRKYLSGHQYWVLDRSESLIREMQI